MSFRVFLFVKITTSLFLFIFRCCIVARSILFAFASYHLASFSRQAVRPRLTESEAKAKILLGAPFCSFLRSSKAVDGRYAHANQILATPV